jgi:hypothetical protein
MGNHAFGGDCAVPSVRPTTAIACVTVVTSPPLFDLAHLIRISMKIRVLPDFLAIDPPFL